MHSPKRVRRFARLARTREPTHGCEGMQAPELIGSELEGIKHVIEIEP